MFNFQTKITSFRETANDGVFRFALKLINRRLSIFNAFESALTKQRSRRVLKKSASPTETHTIHAIMELILSANDQFIRINSHRLVLNVF